MSGRKYILGYFLIAIVAGFSLCYLTLRLDNTDITSYFVILCAISLIILLISVLFKKGRRSQYMLPITLINVVFVTWLICTICLPNVLGNGTLQYVSEKLEKYRSEKGAYPRCKDFYQLSDSIGINGNEYYPEDFDYKSDEQGLFYVLTFYNTDKTPVSTYDSRIGIEKKIHQRK
jgi:hypothetical protein